MQDTRRFHFRSSLLAAASLAVCAGAAQAQTQPAAAPSAVEEVVVTAQRRAEALQDVPISVTAISGAGLERAGVARLEDISRVSAGVQISRTGIFTQPAIRGVSTNVAFFAENNVAIYVDGFYIPSARGLNMEMVNLSQVQVLKGPQGTLFGRNATGGAILIETLQPSLTRTSGRVVAGVGRFNDRLVQGYFSTPLSDTLAVNLAGSYHKNHGYIRDVAGFWTAPQKFTSLTGKVLFEPTDKLSLTASVGTSMVSDPRPLSTTASGRVQALVQFPTSYVEFRPYMTSLSHPTVNHTNQFTYSLKARYDLGFASLNSYTFRQLEKSKLHYELNDASRLYISDSFSSERYKTFTQEVNLTSKGNSRLQYVLGAYYFHSKQNSSYNSYSCSYPCASYIRSNWTNFDTKSYALYADITYQAIDNLYLTGGLRYSREKKDVINFPPPTYAPLPNHLSNNSVTPRAVIRYELKPDTNVYASVSRGFKSAIFNVSAPFNSVLPEKITAYEVGFKTARRAYRFDAAVYNYDYKNLQVSSLTAVNNQQVIITTNAASARIYGADAQITLHPADRLNVSATINYSHARYRKYLGAVVSIPSAVTGLNTSICANAAPPPATLPCTQNWSGRRMLRAPDWSGNLAADYTVPVAAGAVTFSGNVAYQSLSLPTKSDFALGGASGYRYAQPGYAIVNLQAAWTSPDDRWKLSAYGNNVFNKRYFIVNTGTSLSDYHVYGEPRFYGVKIEYSF
jgi:iron complex outermembrane receptor protein